MAAQTQSRPVISVTAVLLDCLVSLVNMWTCTGIYFMVCFFSWTRCKKKIHFFIVVTENITINCTTAIALMFFGSFIVLHFMVVLIKSHESVKQDTQKFKSLSVGYCQFERRENEFAFFCFTLKRRGGGLIYRGLDRIHNKSLHTPKRWKWNTLWLAWSYPQCSSCTWQWHCFCWEKA